MKSQEIKLMMLSELLFGRNYQCAVTECSLFHGIADVLGLTKAGFSHEIEVKCSKQDLKSEIDCLDILLRGVKQEKSKAKLWKHKYYLNNQLKDPSIFDKSNYETVYRSIYTKPSNIPNKFSFCVTKELLDYAKESLKNTPYGLYVCYENNVGEIKVPDYLHKEKMNDENKMSLLRKVSTEIFYVRTELYNLKKLSLAVNK